MLSPQELSLFQDKIRFLDRKIQPSLTKLMWFNKASSSHFINDCLLHIDKVVTHSNINLFEFF